MLPLKDTLKKWRYDMRFRAEVAAAARRSDIPLIKPDFLGIGTARSASTWLHSRLSQHPDVYLPELKELHFFNEPRDHEPCHVSGARWSRPVYFDLDKPESWRWYSAQFLAAGSRLKGEITPDYSTLSKARVAEVYKHLPDAKIMLLIRNPIERAWSGLRYSWKRHWDEALKPEDTDKLVQAALHPERLLRGNYPMTLQNWRAAYPEAQMLSIFYDDVQTDPSAELLRVATFLALDPQKLVSEGDAKRVNEAPEETMPDEVRRALEAHYEKDILWLEHTFSRDLSHWRHAK